jgi:hypothetical protein
VTLTDDACDRNAKISPAIPSKTETWWPWPKRQKRPPVEPLRTDRREVLVELYDGQLTVPLYAEPWQRESVERWLDARNLRLIERAVEDVTLVETISDVLGRDTSNDGLTARPSRINRAKDGAHQAAKVGRSQNPTKQVIKRIDRKISCAERWLQRWGRQIDKLQPLLSAYEEERLRPDAARERRKAARRRARRAGKTGAIEILASAPPRHGPRAEMYEAALELDAYLDAIDAVEDLRIRRWVEYFAAKKSRRRAFSH